MPFNLFTETLEKVSLKKKPITHHAAIGQIIEALLFSSSEPLSSSKIIKVVTESYPLTKQELKSQIEALNSSYTKEERAFRIDEIAEGYLMQTIPKVSAYVSQLHQNRRTPKLSAAAREVLAIIAYKQPVIRAEIEKLRGVDSQGTLQSLIERDLIEIMGRLNAPGRPSQYGTTKRFLTYFGLKSLRDLRKIHET